MDRELSSNFCSKCSDLRERRLRSMAYSMSSSSFVSCFKTLLRCCILLHLFNSVLSAGRVHIFLLKYDNPNGLLGNGTPCPSGSNFPSVTPGVCRVRLHVCLQAYQARLPLLEDINVESCPFGSARTQILDQSYCRSVIENREKTNAGMPAYCAETHVDFSFSWVGSLTAIFELRHHDTSTGLDHMIQRYAKSIRNLNPEDGNLEITPDLDDNIFTRFALGVNCSRGFYGPSCGVACVPRNDNYGHFTCSETGNRICLPGWQGERCTQPICQKGCTNGECVAPNKCRCQHGWEGQNCDECIPYQGCLHGNCNKPFECNCAPRWGGLQCDLDRDYCLHNQPCKNGATCNPDRPNNYTCMCTPGFAGRDCEVKVSPCYKNPCLHFGTCFVKEGDNQYECLCPNAYTGKHCERIRLNEDNYMESLHTDKPLQADPTVREVYEPCFYQGEYFPHGTRWDTTDCRQCSCKDKEVNCTRAACMQEDCLQNNRGCPVEQICQSVQTGLCLKEPCLFPRGHCKPWQLADPGGFPELCRERLDRGEKTEECSRFYARLDEDKLPGGSSVESVCFHVTLWLLTKQMEQFTAACRLKIENPEIWIEIDLAAIKPRWPVTGLKEHLITVLRQNLTVSQQLRAVSAVSDGVNLSVSRWRANQGRLGAVPENELEKQTESSETAVYFGIALCLFVIIVILTMIIVMLHRRLKRSKATAQNLDASFGSSIPFGLGEKSASLATVASMKNQGEEAAKIHWNNLGPRGAGVNACERFSMMIVPGSRPGRPEKQCNLWQCHQTDETGDLESRLKRGSGAGLATKEMALDLGNSGSFNRTVAAVKPMIVVSRQPEHQYSESTVVSKEAVV